MDKSKERFHDFVETFDSYVKESKDKFLQSQEESEKVLQSKLAKNIDFAEKIEERLKTRMDKHNENIQKSTESYDEKIQKVSSLHVTKLSHINETKEKQTESVTNDLEKEKAKLEKALAKLDSQFIKDEKKCLITIEKAEKKAESFNVETNVNKTEKDAQNKLKLIQTTLEKSLKAKLGYDDELKELINKLKEKQAALELLETESQSRVQKLKHRRQKDELGHLAEVANLEQTSLREEIKSNYDLDKVITNYEYNIIHETLKTKERKIDLEYKISNDREEARFYEDTQSLKRDRKYQLEKEHVQLETIIQKDRIDKVKNNFALSNKEHKNLFIYEKALHDEVKARESVNYKLSLEEIDNRTKSLLERVKLSINELKTGLDYITNKVKINLKTELTMPTAQLKLVESKYKTDSKELTKTYNAKVKELENKLAVLDQTFDSDEIKELKAFLEDVELKYTNDSKELEDDYNKIVTTYQNKINYANERANKINEEAKNFYDTHVLLYNNEMDQIKKNAELEKQKAKSLLDSIHTTNDNNLNFYKELNDLAVSQNDEISTYLVEISEENIATSESLNKKRDERTLSRFNERVTAKKEWLKNNEEVFDKAVLELDTKLENYIKVINKKLDVEKKDVIKHINKLKATLKSNLTKLARDRKKLTNSFDQAMKDAELEFSKENKKLLTEQSVLLTQLETFITENGIEIPKKDYDIFYKEKKKKVEEKPEIIEVVEPEPQEEIQAQE